MGTTIIGIDHGNGNMKTAHTVFPCGFKMQETEPSALFAKDIIKYEGKYYSLVPNRFSYQVDKTKDENCFILTLFAIAKELAARSKQQAERGEKAKCRIDASPDQVGERYAIKGSCWSFARDFPETTEGDVILSVGLPPAHFEKQHKTFKEYFEDRGKDGLRFTYNGKRFCLRLIGVMVLPQDYAAAVVYREDVIGKYNTVFCIDIGDGTVDMLALSKGMPDKETMVSRELGMSHLREQIIDDVISDYGMTLDDGTIEDVLLGREVVIPEDIVCRIKQTTGDFAARIVNQLHSKVPDFRIAVTIFCGGGAALLKPYLESTGQFGKTDFIPEIQANAVGYERIAEMSMT